MSCIRSNKKSLLLMVLIMISMFVCVMPVKADSTEVTTSDGWTYKNENGKNVIVRYSGKATDVVIPSDINGVSISEIHGRLDNDDSNEYVCIFDNPNSIKSITVSEGINTIGYYSFRGCNQVQNIIIPQSVKTIGKWALAGCGVTEMNIPDVTYISEGALSSNKIEKITLGKEALTIEDQAFVGAKALKQVIFLGSTPTLKSIDELKFNGELFGRIGEGFSYPTIIVPDAYVNQYKQLFNNNALSEHASYIVGAEAYKRGELPDSAKTKEQLADETFQKTMPALSKAKSSKKKGKTLVSLKWKKVNNAVGYKIYRSTKSNSGYKCVATVKKTKTVSWTDKKAKKKKTYYYRIRAYKKSGKSTIYSKYSLVKRVKTK